MAAFRILVVCVGNVCRSPLAERLLASRLPGEAFVVESAGVGALVGSPMDPSAAAELERYGGTPAGFVARQLTASMTGTSDLVLTATREIRSRVLEEAPAALRRTFTVLELAALLEDRGPVPGSDPAAAVASAAAERSRTGRRELDVPDPFRRGAGSHARAAAQIDRAVTVIVARLGG